MEDEYHETRFRPDTDGGKTFYIPDAARASGLVDAHECAPSFQSYMAFLRALYAESEFTRAIDVAMYRAAEWLYWAEADDGSESPAFFQRPEAPYRGKPMLEKLVEDNFAVYITVFHYQEGTDQLDEGHGNVVAYKRLSKTNQDFAGWLVDDNRFRPTDAFQVAQRDPNAPLRLFLIVQIQETPFATSY
ncbi:MAG: hypothetical protein CMA06_02295 [Euryarchaeota archaeon]|nr:hypothetical protein [Euryarchaeota archaeon]